jgi:hypothetical protein
MKVVNTTPTVKISYSLELNEQEIGWIEDGLVDLLEFLEDYPFKSNEYFTVQEMVDQIRRARGRI